MKRPLFQLTTIRFSHYNEKARWALDRFKIRYSELPLMPVIHFGATWFAQHGKGSGDKHSTRFSTPILRTDKNEVICDSRKIVRYVSDRFSDEKTTLFWHPDVEPMEEYFNERVAPATRAWGYFHALNNRSLMSCIAYRNVGPVQATAFLAILPLVRRIIFKGFKISPQRIQKLQGIIRDEFRAVDEKMKDGRKYLLGDRFSAADLCFACSVAPALLVGPEEGYGGVLPPLDQAHPNARAFAQDLRASAAGEFAMRLFREERGERQILCKPLISRVRVK